MGDVGAPELLIILVVILVMFGGAKLPELARSLGKAKREFHKGMDEGLGGHEHEDAAPEPPAPEALPAPRLEGTVNGHLEASGTEHAADDPADPPATERTSPIDHSG